MLRTISLRILSFVGFRLIFFVGAVLVMGCYNFLHWLASLQYMFF